MPASRRIFPYKRIDFMAVMNVNPTRMELTNLKRKLTTARRGHKLLKDKRDELMRRFLDLVRENKELRRQVESGIKEANKHMAVARSVMSDSALNVGVISFAISILSPPWSFRIKVAGTTPLRRVGDFSSS